MKSVTNRYSLLQIMQFLSLDIVIGTVAVGYMATKVLEVRANPVWWIVLPLAVWVVYTLDHIIDAYKKKREAAISRHNYHYLNRIPIIVVVSIIGLITMALSLLYLNYHIVKMGIILSITVGIYFLLLFLQKDKKNAMVQKELYIAIIYTVGIFMAPIYWHGSVPSIPIIIIAISISLLVWAEGIMISWYDYENDTIDGHNSLTILFGKKNARRFAIVLHLFVETVLVLVLLTTTLTSIVIFSMLIILLMNLILGLLILFPYSFLSNTYHKLIGETVFLLPCLLIFV